MVFQIGNELGVKENVLLRNLEASKITRQRIDRFKELIREGKAPNEAKKIVIEEFKLTRSPQAGTPTWMAKGKQELIAEGFDYIESKRGPENVGGAKKAYDKRKNFVSNLEDRIKRTKQKTGLGKAYEVAHTANIFQAKKLGIDYPIDALAIQTQNINNKVAEQLNNELKPLYRRQLKLFNKMKRKNIPSLKKQMDKVNLELMELVATGGSQGEVAANVLKPIHVNADTLNARIMDLGFDTSTEVKALPGSTTKATSAGSVNDVMARLNVQSILRSKLVNAAKTNEGGVCNPFRAEGGRIGFAAGSSCVPQMEAAFDADPVRTTQQINKIKTVTGKVKDASLNFLKLLGRGGAKAAPLAALAAVGAGIEPLVKQFVIDDPTTYLTDESQMKGMLLATIEGETPKVDEEILKWQMPALGAATAAGAIPGAGEVYKARRGLPPTKDFVGPMEKGVGKTRAALGIKGVLGKALGATFSPLAVAATLPMDIASQRKGGTEWGDIATDPMNWMAPAFASSGAEMASKGIKNPILLKALRLGISPRALSMVSRRFGVPGLAISAGMWGYDKWKNRSINDE
jgi:hypothetical protein